MAFSAADVRFGYRTTAFVAERLDNHLPADEGEGAPDGGGQGHVLAGVGNQDPGDRAGPAQVGGPALGVWGGGQQAAFLMIPAPVIIAIKIFTFFSVWGSHGGDYSTGWLDFCWKRCVYRQESNTPPGGGGANPCFAWGAAGGIRVEWPDCAVLGLDAGDVGTRAGIYPDDIPDFHETGAVDFQTGLGGDFLGHAGSGVAAH